MTTAAALAALITVMTLLFTGACTPDASRDGPGRATSTGAAPATEFGSAEPTGDGVAQLADRALSYDCTDVPPRETGQPTVVLLTGLDNDMTVWDQTRRHLGDVPVCAYDRANVGSSNRVDGPRPIDDSVDELHGFLQAADVPPPYMLVGHSYGGLVTMLYAAAYPQQVHSLLLVDGLLPFEDELDAISNGPRQLARVRAELNDNVEQLTIFGHLPDPVRLLESLPDVPTVYLFGRRQDLTEPGWPPGSYRTRMHAFIKALPNGAIVGADAGHGIPAEDPTAIAQQVTTLHGR